MADLNALLVAGFLVTSAAEPIEKSPMGRDAYHNASIAFYKQSGLEREVSRKFTLLKKTYVSKEVEYYLANSGALARVIIERKISFTWSF